MSVVPEPLNRSRMRSRVRQWPTSRPVERPGSMGFTAYDVLELAGWGRRPKARGRRPWIRGAGARSRLGSALSGVVWWIFRGGGLGVLRRRASTGHELKEIDRWYLAPLRRVLDTDK